MAAADGPVARSGGGKSLPQPGDAVLMGRPTDDDFAPFARHAGPRLRRTAYLLCRDWELAQDLTQTTLAKLFVRWSRIGRNDEPTAYANKVLLRVFLDHKRLRRSREQVVAEVPESAFRE